MGSSAESQTLMPLSLVDQGPDFVTHNPRQGAGYPHGRHPTGGQLACLHVNKNNNLLK